MTAKKTQKLFAAISPDFGPRFAFNAKNEIEAGAKLNWWNRYQGFRELDTAHTIKEIQASDLEGLTIALHNEYVN